MPHPQPPTGKKDCTPSVRKEEARVPDNGFPNKWGRGRRGNGISYSYTSLSHTNATTECPLLHFPPAEQFPPAHVTRIQNRSFLLPHSLSHSECDRALLPTLEHASLVHSSVHEAAFHRPGEMPTTDGPDVPPVHPPPEVAVAAMASHEGVQVILH